MLKFAVAVAVIATAAPAFAGHDHYQPTAQDFRDGRCTRHQVRIPAGKIVHAPPVVRCDASAVAARAQDNAEFVKRDPSRNATSQSSQ